MCPGPSAACSFRTSRGPPPSCNSRPCRQGAGDCSPSPGPPHPLCCMTCAQAHPGTGLECVSFGAQGSRLVLSVLIHLSGGRKLETLPDWLVRPRAEGKRPKWQVKTWRAASQRTPVGIGGLSHTSRGDWLTSVWKVLSAAVLRSLAWKLQLVTCSWGRLILENPDSSFIVFYLRAWVGAAVAGSIFLWLPVVPGTLFGSHVDLKSVDCVLHLALTRERAEVNPAQSIGLSPEQCTLPANLPSSLMDLQNEGFRTPGVTRRATNSQNCGPANVAVPVGSRMLAYSTHTYNER